MSGTTPSGPRPVEAALWWARFARDPLGAYSMMLRRYGTAARVGLPGGRGMYLLSRPEHAEHVLVSHQANYAKAFSYRPFRALIGDGLLTSEGPKWARRRRAVQPVFAARHLTEFVPDIVAGTARGVEAWRDGDVVDAAGELRRITLDIIGQALFGLDLAGEACGTGSALSRTQRGAMVGMMAASVPGIGDTALSTALRRFPGLSGARVSLEALADRTIDGRRTRGDERRGPDVIGRLIAGDGTAAGLEQGELREEVLTLLLAGHETTAAALTWTLILLSRHPDARRALQDEVDAVLGGRPPEQSDADRLRWTGAVVSEAMRLYPPAWTIERDAVADDEVAGVRVPAGATVVISPYLLHRNPDFWPNPEGFAPGRFLDERPRLGASYLPFGGGRRVCVGAGLAVLEATLVLASIAQSHELDLLPGVQVAPRAEITLRPAGPVWMRVRERAPAS